MARRLSGDPHPHPLPGGEGTIVLPEEETCTEVLGMKVFLLQSLPLELESNMPFTYMDHTGDVGIELEADSLEQLYTEASLAFIDIVTDPNLLQSRESVEVCAQAETATDLLLHWLEELVFLFDTRGFLAKPKKLTISKTSGGELRLDANLEGEEIDLSRHPIRVQVKAVTYHQLEVRRDAERWLGRVIFDI